MDTDKKGHGAPAVDVDEIAARNPKVDAEQLREAMELIESFGTRARFRLQRTRLQRCPPLKQEPLPTPPKVTG